MTENIQNCIGIMLCILFGCASLAAISIIVWMIWLHIIEPIIDKCQDKSYKYWEERYLERDKDAKRYYEHLRTLNVMPKEVAYIVPGSVQKLTSHDDCDPGRERKMITYTVDVDKYWSKED